MSVINLQAQVIDGILRLTEGSGEDWFIEHQPTRRAWALFEIPLHGGEEQLYNRYYTLEEAYNATKELT